MIAGVVAGEPSGDLLAARMIQGLRAQDEHAVVQGIGGPAMERAGFNAWHPMDALSVFGYVDALKQAPRLLHIYRDVRRRLLATPPDVFVGVDAPDFNLRLEAQLRRSGVPTVHFVGPSIWAWRYERIHAIRKAVSHMLVLFPFEVELYEREGVPVTYVGHPLAELIPMRPDRAGARRRLGVAVGRRVLALMPGSRASEIQALTPRFLEAVQRLQKKDSDLQVLVPMVSPARRAQFEDLLRETPIAHCTVLDALPDSDARRARDQDGSAPDWPIAWHAMAAADAVLVASGTATLEAALFKRPMVISYVLSPWMRRIMAWKSGQQKPYVPWVGLPNVLAGEFVVPELLQEAATPEALAEQTWKALSDTRYAADVARRFQDIHESLSRDTPTLAARAILKVSERGAA